MHNDCTLKEFIQGEERCLKFINQDLTFLQQSHILSTFTNVSHTTTSLKELVHINLPTRTSNEHPSTENTTSLCTQSVQPALGFTLAKVRQAESNPTLTVPQLLEIEPCREYTETPLKMLDDLFVMQPKKFQPLTQEAKKLAKELCKEEASQCAGLPPEKLLQESFLEQLDALQALDQLAPLTAAKEHLPGDIIDILSHLRKVDNIPFNQLYSLAENCADRYYTKVIQTLARLIKNSFHDRQLILVNTARVLKFLKSYASQQTKLWKVLSKYHNLLDHFHDLKTTLQTEFELLKTATSKNVQNLQETVQAQQAYMTVLSGHIAALHTKLAHLDKQIQIHCIYPHPQSDAVQLNVPYYDPDIDGEPSPINAIQPSNADSVKEETVTSTTEPEDHITICPTTNRSEHQPSAAHSDSQTIEFDNTVQQQAEHLSDYCPQLDDIPELETDKENWDDGQFDDAELLYNHNSTEESNRICCEYSAHFEKVKDQQYSPYHTMQGDKYIIPEPDYYHSNTQPKQYQQQQNQNVYLPPPPSIEDIHTWYSRGRGRARHLEFHGHRLYGEKMRSLESQLERKHKKNQCL